jgi:iron complex outermembrane receptor protein
VEIVRGPQSALYGRNAFAGAVNYVSSGPTEEFKAYVQGVVGDNDRYDLQVSVSGPLSETLRGKFTYATTEYDGHTTNDHPLGYVNTPGQSTQDKLGGYDDSTWSAALDWDVTENLTLGVSYYHSDLQRELQPYYVIGGLNSVAQGFIPSSRNDMNCNFAQTTMQGSPAPVFGNTTWCGELPEMADPNLRSVSGITVDPRGIGADADTDLVTFSADWKISDGISMTYLYGHTDHSSYSNGGTGEEDPLVGVPSLWQFIPPGAPPAFLPFPQLTYAYANQSSGRPVSDLKADSHEIRFNFEGTDTWTGSAGLYYSDVDDEEMDFLWFMPVCSDMDVRGVNSNGSNADEIANCSIPISGAAPSPYAGAPFVTTNDFGSRQHGTPLNQTRYSDKIWAAFASFTWNVGEKWALTAEGRYESEDKKITRLTDSFGLAPGESAAIFPGGPPTFVTIVPSSIFVPQDSETFDFFTPRFIAQFTASENSMWYGSIAKGVKTGGFNNTLSQDQLTYDEEENWTYEIGTKNILADGHLMLNAAIYYIDWSDLQGTSPPHSTGGGLSTNNVVDNIGDASATGLEIEGAWFMSDHWSLDFGYSYNNPEYDKGVKYRPAVQFVHCDGITCPADGDVSGNNLPRTSNTQFSAGLNFRYNVFGGWLMDWRFDGNYQSKQYTDPLNLAWVPDRTLFNTALSLTSPNQHWDLTLWGRNIFDETYPANAFAQEQFNRYLVSLGQRSSWGLTARYNF